MIDILSLPPMTPYPLSSSQIDVFFPLTIVITTTCIYIINKHINTTTLIYLCKCSFRTNDVRTVIQENIHWWDKLSGEQVHKIILSALSYYGDKYGNITWLLHGSIGAPKLGTHAGVLGSLLSKPSPRCPMKLCLARKYSV